MAERSAVVGIEWMDGSTRRAGLTQAAAAALGALLLAAPLTGLGTRPSSAPDVAVIVRAAPGTVAGAERAVARLGGKLTRPLSIINGFSARVPAAGVAQLRAMSVISEVDVDAAGHLMSVDPALGYDVASDLGAPTDTQSIIDANPAYAKGVTGKGVDVALIDSGVAPVAGLDAPGKVINGVDVSFDSQAPNLTHLDGYGHGTHMAGIIAGKDAGVSAMPDPTRFTGIAPDARIVNVKAGAADGSVDVSQVIAAIDWVVQHRSDNGMNIRVLNLSFGTDSTQDYTVDPLAYAAEVAWRKGIVVVVSAGNDGKTNSTLADPAIDPYVIAAGASDNGGTLTPADDYVAAFSSAGNGSRHADFVAPGRSIISLRVPNSQIDVDNPDGRVGDRFMKGSGTSQAAAVASGAVALLLQQRPALTPDQVKAVLTKTAKHLSGGSKLGGAGLIDVGQAMLANPPNNTQNFTVAKGTGSLEAARGASHIYDPTTGVALTGEQDIFGQPWDGSRWSTQAWNGSTWSGGSWNGSTWSGSTWSGSTWSGSRWSGSTWSGSTWRSLEWSSNTWTGSRWSGSTWSGSRWSGSTWSGSTWSASDWAALIAAYNGYVASAPNAPAIGETWDGQVWNGHSWNGHSWSGHSWTGHSWSDSDWA